MLDEMDKLALRVLVCILVAPLAGALLLTFVFEVVFAIGVMTDPGMRAVTALEAQDR